MINAKDIDIKVCTHCKKFFYRNKWAEFNSAALEKVVKNAIRENAEIKEIKLPKHKKNPGVNVDGEARVEYEGETYLIPFKIRYTLCQKCGKMHSEYYEAILQLRNPNDEAVRFIENAVKKNREKYVFITKKEKVTNGIDFYLTSQRFAQYLGKKLKKAFNAELKISRKLFTINKQTSKKVYRVNVLARLKKES